jgi:LPS sulfotransferase NodH
MSLLQNGYVRLRRAADALPVYARALMQPAPRRGRSFVIFGQGRSGSTLLCDLFNCHPQVTCEKEILFHPRRFPLHYVLGRRRAAPPEDVYGFKVKIYQLTDAPDAPRRMLAALDARGWHIVYLWRRNVVRQALSGLTAWKRGNVFHAHSGEERRVTTAPVTIPVHSLVRDAYQRLRWLQKEAEMLDGFTYATVNYEDDLKDAEARRATMNRLFTFLELPPAPAVSTDLRRTSRDDLAAQIKNYSEVYEGLVREGLGSYVPAP